MSEETLVSPVAETQNPAPESTEKPELVTPGTEAPETQEDSKPDDPVAKIQARFDRRISKATAARYQAEARAQQAEQRAQEVAARLAQYEQQTEESPQITPDKVLPIAQQIAAHWREQERVKDSVQKVLTEGKGLEGFDAACNAVNEELPFYDQQNGAPTPFLRVVMECEAPAKVLHYLGTNPDVASELSDLTPTQQARRLARIEADLSKEVEPAKSNAPRPVTPVKASGGGPKDPLAMTDAEFAAWRKEQIKSRR